MVAYSAVACISPIFSFNSHKSPKWIRSQFQYQYQYSNRDGVFICRSNLFTSRKQNVQWNNRTVPGTHIQTVYTNTDTHPLDASCELGKDDDEDDDAAAIDRHRYIFILKFKAKVKQIKRFIGTGRTEANRRCGTAQYWAISNIRCRLCTLCAQVASQFRETYGRGRRWYTCPIPTVLHLNHSHSVFGVPCPSSIRRCHHLN